MEIKKQISGNDQHDQQLSLDYTRCRPSTLNVGFGSSKSASREGGGQHQQMFYSVRLWESDTTLWC